MNRILAFAVTLIFVIGLSASTTVLASQATGTGQAAAQTKLVNLNTATAAELEKLPGVGTATAARIIEYREKNGGFKKVEDLMNVRGIGEKTFLNLKSLITVAPPKVTGH